MRTLRLEPLSVRLAVGVALIVVGPLVAALYFLTEHHIDHSIDARRKSAELENRILEVALRHRMMEKDPDLLADVLEEIGLQPGVEQAVIVNHEGEIRAASRPDLVGEAVSFDSPSCVVCHSKDPALRDRWTVIDEESGPVLRTVLPIENRKECHACHDPGERLNGILLYDLSLATLYAEIREDRAVVFAWSAAVALLLLLGVGVLVRRLVLDRLRRLGDAARSFAAGNLSERAAVDGDDVIAALAREFNDMAGAVSRLIGELSEQESQLASVMNSLSDGLVVLDSESRVVASNRAFCRRLGSHPEALRGHRCCDAVAGALPCCSSDAECPAQRCLLTGEVQRMVYETTTDDARRIVEEVHASPIFNANGEVAQTVEVWRDISERVHEEERLAEIERLVSLGALASGFSHEVSTPLASTLICAESILGQIEESGNGSERTILPAIRDHANTIREQVLRCRRITDQFMRFSRGIPPSVEPVQLREAVQTAVSLVAPTARDAGVELKLEGDEHVTGAVANTEVVQHVVLNLLINAIQSCDGKGGTVVVSFPTDGEPRIHVRDTGCGIQPENRAWIFEPFHSRKVNGTGLGLFLSRNFMRRFGGDVRIVDSTVGVGSCLEIVFARTRDAVEDANE